MKRGGRQCTLKSALQPPGAGWTTVAAVVASMLSDVLSLAHFGIKVFARGRNHCPYDLGRPVRGFEHYAGLQ